MIVYLAGHHDLDDYRAFATRALEDQGHRVLDPFRPGRDYRHREGASVESIVRGDLADIVASTHVLCDFSRCSQGHPMEAWFAHSIGRPVTAFVDGTQRISPWVRYVSRTVHTSLLDALEDLCPGCFS